MSDIKQKTKIGMLWNIFEKIVVQGIAFVLNIILARLLTPHDYGIVGMLTIFLTFSNVFIDSGFSRALIQKQDRKEQDFSTTLIFNIAVSCLLYGVLFLASPTIARFYKTAELVTFQRVFFLVIILNSLTVVQNAQLQIKVDFKRIAIINSIATLTSGIIGVTFAFLGFGAWALIIQSLSKAFISSLCFWIIGHWIPRTGFSYMSFKKLFGFGSKLLASGLLGVTITNINNLVIGKIYSPSTLGYYTRAQQFPELTSGTLNNVLNGVTFPLLSSLQNDGKDLVTTFKKLLRMTAMIVFPAMVGIAVLAKPIILVLLGEKWFESSTLLFWLALSYIFIPLSTLNLNVLNAIGRSDLFLKVDLLKIPIIILTMIITFPISLKAVVMGKTITAFIYYYMNAYMLGRIYNFNCFKQLACIWKYLISAILMGVIVFLITICISSDFLSLIFGIIIGIISYMIFLFILKDEEYMNMIGKIILKVRKRF